jgi:hypothetical protein
MEKKGFGMARQQWLVVTVSIIALFVVGVYASALPSLERIDDPARNAAAATALRLKNTAMPAGEVLPRPATERMSVIVADAPLDPPVRVAPTAPAAIRANPVNPSPSPVVAQADTAPAAAVVAVESVDPPATAAPAITGITEDAARAIVAALDTTATLLRPVEVVVFRDVPCYEFSLDHGTVYVATVDGSIIYNGIAVFADARERATAAPRQATAVAVAAPPLPKPTQTVLVASAPLPPTASPTFAAAATVLTDVPLLTATPVLELVRCGALENGCTPTP